MLKQFLSALDVLEETGSADEVFQLVNRIAEQRDRESTFRMLAKYFARRGQLDEVSRFTEAIRDEIETIHCLQEVARELRRKRYAEVSNKFLQKAYEKAGNFSGSALDTAHIFLTVSVELHDSGRIAEAVALLHRAIELSQTAGKIGGSKFLLGCSMQLGKWNRPEEARAVAESIREDWFRKHPLKELERNRF